MKKVLVANRGEIALRVFRAAGTLGLETVAVAAPDDSGSLHARSAGELVEIASYLDPREHLRAAAESGADAIHPGYGFLAESPDFAEAVVAAGLTWIGPPPAALRSGGDKLEAKRLAAAAGVPTIPEGDEPPLIVKAAAGGGGRGMRVVRARGDLAAALEAARTRGTGRLRRRPRVPRAVSRTPAPPRGAAACGLARTRPRARRARLFGAAPPSESSGGVPRSGARTRTPLRAARGRGALRRGHRLQQRRHGRVRPRRGTSSSFSSSTRASRSSIR